jgi:hypothetical protein
VHLLCCCLSLSPQDSLLEHVAALADLSHPNLVRICGVVIDPPLVVTEFHKHSLDSVLQQAREQWRGGEAAAAAAAAAREGGGAREGGVPSSIGRLQVSNRKSVG